MASCGYGATEGFQSTPPHGRRQNCYDKRTMEDDVSIHASAREATKKTRARNNPTLSFNPRLRTGGDKAAR